MFILFGVLAQYAIVPERMDDDRTYGIAVNLTEV
jgi:hypothetical protein